ncbi:hypothetical protein MYX07_00640 [Patescibacteria group bacterium AH-259-L07]|nr:hypothetical protein [Patescibacteria group bacterium AH-259-L07]
MPVKFQLKDAQENFISGIQPLIYIAEIINGVPQPEQPAVSSGKANLDNIARYDLDKNQYVFNLSTKDLSPGQYQIRADLGDESIQTITVTLEQEKGKGKGKIFFLNQYFRFS